MLCSYGRRLVDLIIKQQSIIDEYKKYDTFLAAHGFFNN